MKSVLRERHRYIAFRVIIDSSAPADKPFLQTAVKEQLLEKMGEIGYARADPRVAYVGRGDSAILRCAHSEAEEVRAALTLVTHL